VAVALDQLVLEQRERHRRTVAMREEAQIGPPEDDATLDVAAGAERNRKALRAVQDARQFRTPRERSEHAETD
jgi:hypothetical protein